MVACGQGRDLLIDHDSLLTVQGLMEKGTRVQEGRQHVARDVSNHLLDEVERLNIERWSDETALLANVHVRMVELAHPRPKVLLELDVVLRRKTREVHLVKVLR